MTASLEHCIWEGGDVSGLVEDNRMYWAIDRQGAGRWLNRRRKRRLTLADAIEVVSQFSHDDHETGLVVADLINRGLIVLRDPSVDATRADC